MIKNKKKLLHKKIYLVIFGRIKGGIQNEKDFIKNYDCVYVS